MVDESKDPFLRKIVQLLSSPLLVKYIMHCEKTAKEIVKKNDTYQFQATLGAQTCTEAQQTFYLLSFVTCLLVLLQIFVLICYFCYQRLKLLFYPNFLEPKNENNKEEDNDASE